MSRPSFTMVHYVYFNYRLVINVMSSAKKVLIVDEDAITRYPFVAALKKAGYEVIEGTSGTEGLTLALSEKPDLTILDVVMPDMSGIEVLKKIREDEWGKTAKVIQLTDIEDMDIVADAAENQVVHYAIKSATTLDRLITMVDDLLRD